MVFHQLFAITLALGCFFGASTVRAATFDNAALSATQWLELQQDQSDGSWGNTPALKPIYTATAVSALQSYNRRGNAYYAGLAWLKNHAAGNTDYRARRLMILADSGASVTADLQSLFADQRTVSPDNNGWGLTAAYNGSALDTALALRAIRASGQAFNASSALAYLKTTQLTGSDKGWSISQSGTSDATTNAQTIIALAQYLTQDATLATPLSNAASTLSSQVTVSAPLQMRALAAQALLMQNANSTAGANLLSGVVAQQVNGAWDADVFTTASVIQALAVVTGRDLSTQRQRVDVPDSQLRDAINLALGRGALDQLNRGELAKLTSLDISNHSVGSLSGLEYATGLTSLNAANNSITDTTPINNLTQLANLNLSGNPCAGCTAVAGNEGDAPLPGWALVALASALLGLGRRKNSRSPEQ